MINSFQDPVLFSGTSRMNLNPAGRYSDESIWEMLESVNLKTYIASLNFGLQCAVEDGGSNFRQVYSLHTTVICFLMKKIDYLF